MGSAPFDCSPVIVLLLSRGARRIAYYDPSLVSSSVTVKGATYWVAADLTSANGITLAAGALRHIHTAITAAAAAADGANEYRSRVAIFHNSDRPSLTASLIAGVRQTAKPKIAFTVVRQALALAQAFGVHGMNEVADDTPSFLRCPFDRIEIEF